MKYSPPAFLEVHRLIKTIGSNTVISGITFRQREFERIAIAGETGSGKSTLLKMIAGLIQKDSGDLLWLSEAVKGPEERLVPGEPGIAYLSQHFELPKSLRVEQVLTYANKLPEAKAKKIYVICRISDLLARRTDELSGGEKQRIALAQVLIRSPKLLLLDEPFSNLDIVSKNVLKQVVDDICTKLRISAIMVSHDPADLLSWPDKIIVLKHGKILQQGSPQEIYRRPVNEYIAGLFGVYNRLDQKLFSALSQESGGSFPRGKKYILLRPEDIKITQKNKGVAANVTHVRFCGSYSEVKTSTVRGDHSVVIHTAKSSVKPGDVLRITLK